MKKTIFLLLLVVFAQQAISQTKTSTPLASKPKLVVGIVIDQMRWDYLYRFQPLFKANGGFKRMMGEGFSCDNTMSP